MVNTEAIINEEEDPNLEITNLKMEIEKLKKELAFYKGQNPLQNSVSITNYFLIIIYCIIVIFFCLQLENKIELTPARIKEFESHVFSYLKDPSDEFPVVKDLGTVQMYFKIFKKIFKSCQNSAKEKDPPVANNKNIKKFEEIIKRKNNEICILACLINWTKCLSAFLNMF